MRTSPQISFRALLLVLCFTLQIQSVPQAYAVTTCAQGGICVLGDTGPGGGKVFDVSGRNYLEAAASDLSQLAWADAIAAGSAYRVNGLSGWRIPTLDESKLMMVQRSYLYFASNEYYWTSTESDASNAYFNNMSFTSWYPWVKTSPRYSRPVRAFSPLKINPEVTMSLVSGLSTAIFRTATTFTITSNTPGRFTLKANGKSIAGCVNLSITTTRNCSYSATSHGSVLLTVKFSPNDATTYNSVLSRPLFIGILPRISSR